MELIRSLISQESSYDLASSTRWSEVMMSRSTNGGFAAHDRQANLDPLGFPSEEFDEPDTCNELVQRRHALVSGGLERA